MNKSGLLTLPDSHIRSGIGPVNAFFPKGLTIDLDKVFDRIPLKDFEDDSSRAMKRMMLEAMREGKFTGVEKHAPYCPDSEKHWDYAAMMSKNGSKEYLYEVPPTWDVALMLPVHKSDEYERGGEGVLREIVLARPAHMLLKGIGIESGIVRTGEDEYCLTSGITKDEKGGLKAYLARRLELNESSKRYFSGILKQTMV